MLARAVVVRTGGGLGNRIRTLLSAASYAQATGRHFAYDWKTSRRFGASLDDLWINSYRRVPWRLSRAVGRFYGYTQTEELEFDDPHRFVLLLGNMPVLRHDARLVPWPDRFRALEPRPEIVERVRQTWSDGWRDRPAVGVMIRAHGKVQKRTAATSPPEWFVARMHEIRRSHPDVAFFLSTDSPSASALVHREIDGVYELADKAGFNTRLGLQGAVCDLYLLAATNYIVGSYWSSFSGMARELARHGGYETSQSPPKESLGERLDAPPPEPPTTPTPLPTPPTS